MGSESLEMSTLAEDINRVISMLRERDENDEFCLLYGPGWDFEMGWRADASNPDGNALLDTNKGYYSAHGDTAEEAVQKLLDLITQEGCKPTT